MPIFLRSIGEPKAIGQWRFRPAPDFYIAPRFQGLVSDIRRYVDGEISGKSYLIAGHRGAGKTSLVARATELVRQEKLDASAEADTPFGVAQRPLIVKLYGPSLMEVLPLTEAELTLKSKMAALKQAGLDPGLDPEDEARRKLSQAALVQITIALYRALAGEVAEAYGFQARDAVGKARGRALEQAAQLALELDTVTEPVSLRDYWSHAGRLERGVLWPRLADAKLREKAPDQGVREIIAIAAAGQAFAVCSGAVSYSETAQKGANQASEVKGDGTNDLAKVLGRLGSLGLGALTGVSLWSANPGPLALIAGASVWLLGTATLSWSFNRKRHVDVSSDYTFVRDRSIQTLDRDLPVVIRRIREAGLAPVFVIDELDKLQTPAKSIAQIIDRLKHLIADNGFFCFLADRAYYDEVDDRIASTAFPKEHTYFGSRRLVYYSPTELRGFLGKELEVGDATDAGGRAAREVYVRWVTLRSELNFSRVMNDLSQLRGLSKSDGDAGETILAIAAGIDVKLTVAVQLAMDLVLAGADLSTRMARDPAFAQLAYDGLFALPNAWKAGLRTYDANPDALKTYLETRLAQDGVSPTIEPGDLDDLVAANRALIEWLVDFKKLADAVAKQNDELVADCASSIPVDHVTGLLKGDPKTGQYEFRVDVFGRKLDAPSPSVDPDEIDALHAMILALNDLLVDLAIEFDDLTAAALVPALSWRTVLEADTHLATQKLQAALDSDAEAAINVLRSLRSGLSNNGAKLAAGLRLARQLQIQGAVDFKAALRVLARYPVLGGLRFSRNWKLARFEADHPDFPSLAGPRLTPVEADIRAWARAFATSPPDQPLPKIDDNQLWNIWEMRIGDRPEARGRSASLAEVRYLELVAAARQIAPANLLQVNLDRVTPAEWSQIALAATPWRGRVDTTSVWAAIAALRVLGWSAPHLKGLVGQVEEQLPPAQRQRLQRLAATSIKSSPPAGYLVIYDPNMPRPLPAERGLAALMVTPAQVRQYWQSLDFLISMGLFQAVFEEITGPPPATSQTGLGFDGPIYWFRRGKPLARDRGAPGVFTGVTSVDGLIKEFQKFKSGGMTLPPPPSPPK